MPYGTGWGCVGPPDLKAQTPNGPEHVNRPEAALKYLSRYVVGSVISNARIVSDIDGQITIRVKDYRNGGEWTTVSMPGVKFVRRFMLHDQ